MTQGFIEFVYNLTPAQVRALASQAGFAGWAAVETDLIRTRLYEDADAFAIYKANYPA